MNLKLTKPAADHPAGVARHWPGYLLKGRVRTSTVVLIIAFAAVWWVYDSYRTEPAPPAAPQVVPPGFIPDPNYTWVPRTRLQQPPVTITETVTPTPTTESPTPTEPPTGETPVQTPVPGFPFCPPICPPEEPEQSPAPPESPPPAKTPVPTPSGSPSPSTPVPSQSPSPSSPVHPAVP